MPLEYYVVEKNDYSRIRKLRTIHSVKNFWNEVRKFTKNIHSDHSIRRWEILAEARLGELKQAHNLALED